MRAVVPSPATPCDERDELEVLADREVVVEQRRVGHERERGARVLGVRLGVRIVAATRTLPPLGSSSPAIVRTAVDLPLPLAPMSATHSPGRERQVERVERDEAAVAARQAVDPEGWCVGHATSVTRARKIARMAEPVGRPNVVSYAIDPRSAALVGVDFQVGFGHGFEPVPHADEAVANFVALARAWRSAGGTVIHVHTTYTPEREPTGRITDFVPGIAGALSEGSPLAAFYDGMVEDGDVLVPEDDVQRRPLQRPLR